MAKILNANALVNLTDVSRAEWLELRKRGIGGSDAGAILGLNPYTSAFQVYCDKKGMLEEKEDNEAMRQGRDLEEYVARRFEEKEGKEIRRCNFMLQHPEHEFMLADVDRLVVGEPAGLECKTTSILTKTDYEGGDIPPQYYAQCVHYMAVTGATHWYIAILILNKGFYVFRIDRNEGEIAALTEREREFWENHLLAGNPPEPDGSERAGKVIQQLFPGIKDTPVVLLYGQEDMMRRYKELEAQIKSLETEQDRLKQAIQLEMKDATLGKAEGFTVKFSPQSRTSVDSKALKAELPDIYARYARTSSFRRFEIKVDKENT